MDPEKLNLDDFHESTCTPLITHPYQFCIPSSHINTSLERLQNRHQKRLWVSFRVKKCFEYRATAQLISTLFFLQIKMHAGLVHSRYPSSQMNKPPNHLPLHLVWLVTLSQTESATKVAGKEGFLLDGSEESLVDGLLVCGTAAGWLLLLFNMSILRPTLIP